MRSGTIQVLLVFGLLAPAGAAGEDGEKAATGNAACKKRHDALVERMAKARREFSESYRAATTDEERAKAFEERLDPEDLAKEFLAIVKDCPEDETAYEALVWVASNCRRGDDHATALRLLREKYLARRDLDDVLKALAYATSPDAEKLLRAAADGSPHREVKGTALYILGLYLKRQVSMADLLTSLPPEHRADWISTYGDAYVDRLTGLDAANEAREIESVFVRVEKEFGDVEGLRRGRTLGESATAELFEIRNLAIGKVAPEIEGEDISGERFKLSDYRGKVVVLDFWGHW